MIIQLDLVKAYDKLSWSYIRAILKAYGFDHNWIRWVMALVTSTNFSILLNGAPSRTFTPSRGLRQGDPLSLFLFILMMEGIGRAIKRANAEGRIQGIKLTVEGEANTHQQFVDDTMLQGIPTVREARAIKNILNDFAMAVGTEIRSIQRDFLWGREEEKKKWALIAWDKLYKPNSHGGLGLHNPKTLSRVSEAKLWWRWIKEPNAPRAKLWKHKYAKYWQEKDHIRMSGQLRGCHIWNLVWDNKNIVQQHCFWEIRAGNLARFWEDNWQQEPNLYRDELAALKSDTDSKGMVLVKDFWDQGRNNRKWRKWKDLGYSDENPLKTKAKALTQELEHRRILVSSSMDQLIWGKNTGGNFNLKEAKQEVTGFNFVNPDQVWKKLWQSPHWMKIKLFIWLVH
eukprot:PITA_36326